MTDSSSNYTTHPLRPNGDSETDLVEINSLPDHTGSDTKVTWRNFSRLLTTTGAPHICVVRDATQDNRIVGIGTIGCVAGLHEKIGFLSDIRITTTGNRRLIRMKLCEALTVSAFIQHGCDVVVVRKGSYIPCLRFSLLSMGFTGMWGDLTATQEQLLRAKDRPTWNRLLTALRFGA